MNKPTPGKKPAAKNFLENLLPAAAAPSQGYSAALQSVDPQADPLPLAPVAAAVPPAPRLEYVTFSSRLTIDNDLRMSRVAHYVPGMSKVVLLNEAVRLYLAQFPEADKPLPSERPR